MNAHLDAPDRASPLLLAATLAVILFGAAVVGSLVGILPGAFSPDHSLDPVVLPAAIATPHGAACANCGTVVVIRTFEVRDGAAPSADSSRGRLVYRVTLQMEDGSYRTLSQNASPKFAIGDKVRLIRGAVVGEKS